MSVASQPIPASRPGGYAELAAEVRELGLMNRRPVFYAGLLGVTLLALAASVAGLLMLHDTWWALLVAPVTTFQARKRSVYLPAGSDWYDTGSGMRVPGGQDYTTTAPRERMPLFVRAGSIIPLGRDVQWTGEDPQGPLTIPYVTRG